jgi:rare lipoprotein A
MAAGANELVVASTYNDGTRDPTKMTAAHKTLPFGTHLTLKHGHRVVVVRVTDRGPFIKGRTLDLTPAANKFLQCGGLCRVKIEHWPPLPKSRPDIPEARFAWGQEE